MPTEGHHSSARRKPNRPGHHSDRACDRTRPAAPLRQTKHGHESPVMATTMDYNMFGHTARGSFFAMSIVLTVPAQDGFGTVPFTLLRKLISAIDASSMLPGPFCGKLFVAGNEGGVGTRCPVSIRAPGVDRRSATQRRAAPTSARNVTTSTSVNLSGPSSPWRSGSPIRSSGEAPAAPAAPRGPFSYSSAMLTDSMRISSLGLETSPWPEGPTGTEASASTTSMPSITRPNWV